MQTDAKLFSYFRIGMLICYEPQYFHFPPGDHIVVAVGHEIFVERCPEPVMHRCFSLVRFPDSGNQRCRFHIFQQVTATALPHHFLYLWQYFDIGERNDLYPGISLADNASQLNSVPAWHLYIEEEYIRLMLRECI